MQKLKQRWETNKLGSVIGANSDNKDRITFAMFADDTTLIARSRRSLEKMLKDVQEELASIGLNLNASKCSIQCSGSRFDGTKELKFMGQSFPMVSCDVGFKVLGTTFTLNGNCAEEFAERLKAGYGKFHQFWKLLGKRGASLKQRLRLFQATVTQSVLWCSESWALTAAQKRHLRA
eukprot:11641336-Karenia_brevis.AAC.1